MSLSIKNETHWRDEDILRIIRAAIEESGSNPKRKRVVNVRFGASTSVIVSLLNRKTVIDILLPKRGPRIPHPNAMLTLAVSAIETDTQMLAPSQSFWLANFLAYKLAPFLSPTHEALFLVRHSENPPSWGDVETFIITKDADPTTDGTYLEFVKKKETAIKRAVTSIRKAEADISSAQSRLVKARLRKKTAEKALVDARKRREP